MSSNSSTHHYASINGATLHYQAAGTQGSPILLVHGFPETSRAFDRLIPHLAETHRVFAVDLRGFGESSHGEGEYGSAASAEDLHRLIGHLDVGPVHISAQDISGGAVFRLAATHPEDLLSLTGIETGIAGFGFERVAGVWYIRVLVTPGVAEWLLVDRERELLDWIFGAVTADVTSIPDDELAEFVRAYSVPGAWRGPAGLYASALSEGEEMKALAAAKTLTMPVLAVGTAGGSFTADTLDQVSATPVTRVQIDGVGHYVALEAPEALASAMLTFIEGL
ncbi:MAG: alpha/beta hydrolase [Pseudolysinimonas sp.]|uniref:alpha/beta fold hydrolase n=1 Tax=Pseudolysinimonas sp. TaxID=2680009 RepID=UPI0032658200